MQRIVRPVLGTLAALALLSGVACSSRNETPDRSDTTDQTASTQAAPTDTSQPSPTTPSSSPSTPASLSTDMSVADLVKLAEPAVVRIQTPTGVGTGFIVSEDGYIVTNNHVIASQSGRPSTSIQVTLSDGSQLTATVIGTDVRSDLAVLKVEVTGIKPLKLGNLADTVVGQDVVAIGYALDLRRGEGPSFSVTRGIISAKNRGIDEGSEILGALQTDAAITHGNSGGPLLNLKGEVVGVNTAIAPDGSGGTAAGIGFAVGADTVKAVYEEIREKGRVDRALLGIQTFTALRPAQARELEVPEDVGGILISGFTSEGAAAAGITTGDVITKIGDTEVRTESELAVAMIRYDAGDVVTVEFYRDGEKHQVEVTLGAAPG